MLSYNLIRKFDRFIYSLINLSVKFFLFKSKRNRYIYFISIQFDYEMVKLTGNYIYIYLIESLL